MCKLVRFQGSISTNTDGAPPTGVSGVRVNRDATGALLDKPIIYWSSGEVTDLLYNVVTPVADIADYAAAKVAEQGDCNSDVTQFVKGEDSQGDEVVIKLVNGLYDSATYLADGSAYTGTAEDLNWDDESDKEVVNVEICFNGDNVIALIELSDGAQGGSDIAKLVDNIETTLFVTPLGVPLTTQPTQTDFDNGVASIGLCKVATIPPSFDLCSSC